MKKSSLMGASVVAAALLAAAPVAAPVASLATSGTQVVKAADYDTPTNEVAQKVAAKGTTTTLSDSELSDFRDVLQVITRLAPATSSPVSFGENDESSTTTHPLYLDSTDIKTSDKFVGYVKAVKGKPSINVTANKLLDYFIPTIDLITTENANAAKKMYYSLEFSYSNAIGDYSYVISTGRDAQNAATDLKNNGGSVTLSMQLYDSYKHSMGSAGLLKSTVKYNAINQRAAYVDYTDTLNAHVGDSANKYVLTNSFVNSNGVIRNYNGEDITDLAYKAGAITVGQLFDINGHAAAAKTDIVNGNFAKTGQYYQNVVIDLPKAGVDVPGHDWGAAAKGGLISVNGQMPSLTNADANVYLVTAKDTLVNGQKYQPGQLILKRTVNVDADQGAFKTDKINGVVTVNMNDGMAAQVYDENGKQVLGRALPNKSAWKSFEKRTYYKDGQVFYQVSTNEYLKSQDVNYTEKSSSSNSNSNDQLSGKVNVTKYPSKVINILNDDHAAGVYAINEDGQGMHQVIGRFLPSGSAWINQGTAEVNGNLFYQVSTNEWVSSNSVVK